MNVKEQLNRIILSWWFQWSWTVMMALVLIWNISTGSSIGVLISLLGLIAMLFALHKHWETQVMLRNQRNREKTRQWTEDDL